MINKKKIGVISTLIIATGALVTASFLTTSCKYPLPNLSGCSGITHGTYPWSQTAPEGAEAYWYLYTYGEGGYEFNYSKWSIDIRDNPNNFKYYDYSTLQPTKEIFDKYPPSDSYVKLDEVIGILKATCNSTNKPDWTNVQSSYLYINYDGIPYPEKNYSQADDQLYIPVGFEIPYPLMMPQKH